MAGELEEVIGGVEEGARVHAVQVDELGQRAVHLDDVAVTSGVAETTDVVQGGLVDIDLGRVRKYGPRFSR